MKLTFAFATVITVFFFAACSDGETERDATSESTSSSTEPAQKNKAGSDGVTERDATPESTSSSTEPAQKNKKSTVTSASAEEKKSGNDRAEEILQDDVHQTEEAQSNEEAFASDLAESNGWTLEEAQAYEARTEAVGDVADQIAVERPEIFVGSAVGPEPYDPPRLYIKGPADEFVHSLVDAAPVEILVIDNEPYSSAELKERMALLSQELSSVGLDNFSLAAYIQQAGLETSIQHTHGGTPQIEDMLLSLFWSIQ